MFVSRDNEFLRRLCAGSIAFTLFLLLVCAGLGGWAITTRREYAYFYSSEYVVKQVLHFNAEEIRMMRHGK